VPVSEALSDSGVTFVQALSTALIAAFEPARPSAGIRAVEFSASTQRIFCELTSWASHGMLTALSRPEKPPIPATSASLEMIAGPRRTGWQRRSSRHREP